MDSRDESLFPEMGNVQEDFQHIQGQQHAWGKSSRIGFVYSSEKVNKADTRSLDRVWERLEEHVARNSAAYQTNRNVPALRTKAVLQVIEREQQTHPQKHNTFHHRLNMLAAACVLLLLVGSLLVVFHMVRHVGGDTTTGSHGQVTPSSPIAAGKISIIQGKDGVEFNPLKIKMQAGASILLGNDTGETQVVVLDGNHKPVTLAPKASMLLPVGNAGSYTWHLESNPSAQVNIVVFSSISPRNNTITIVPSKTGKGAEFTSGKQVLKVGTAIIWVNGTDQTQVIVSESDGKNIPLVPKSGTKTVFGKAGIYTFHLNSDTGAQVTVIVEN